MSTSIEIQLRPMWLDNGDSRERYHVDCVDVDKYLHGKIFRKTIDNTLYEIRFEKEYIRIHDDKPPRCKFMLKISKGKKHQKERMLKGLKILGEFSEEVRKAIVEKQKERNEWLSQDTLAFSI